MPPVDFVRPMNLSEPVDLLGADEPRQDNEHRRIRVPLGNALFYGDFRSAQTKWTSPAPRRTPAPHHIPPASNY
ncbi:hypothetical protein NG798_24530 [Ancylothrix sp. C2]|uniref:hypothetical protein n=1 Tax=Ancylothrix sp. D3o TaxID=2953691 RepID=UPI0021BA458A|nr:hypothetical protein [Ancylothrix sp. D3o]MCT7952969.1 hypothetical protein [Ancylothrix sp. D3o]